MKQQRRHELKTNDLSVYLTQIYEAIQRNSRYVLGGTVVVVVVLIVFLVAQRNRMAAEAAAWTEYDGVRSGDLTADPSLLDKARELAERYADDKRLGPSILLLEGSMLYMSALNLTGPDQKAQQIEQLREARQVFSELIRRFESRRNVRAEAKMMLAKIEESLIVLGGGGDVDTIRSIYQELKDSPTGLYAGQAEERLANLDERLVPLKIVDPPATAPAAAEEPSAVPMPAAETTTAPAVEAATTAPATAPAS